MARPAGRFSVVPENPASQTHQYQGQSLTERKVLKEKLLALKEEDLPHILAASGLKLRGEDANIVDGLLVDLFGVVAGEARLTP